MEKQDLIEDTKLFVSMAAEVINDSMSSAEISKAVLFLALSMERALKHALFSINPIYVLESAEFRHSVPALYASQMISTSDSKEIDSKPNTNLITFRVSLTRAKLFSNAAVKNSQILFTIANWRDVIAHRVLSELDIEKLHLMLKKDAFPLVKDFAEEQGCDVSEYFGEHLTRIKTISDVLIKEERFRSEMMSLISDHKKLWLSRKSNKTLQDQALERTKALVYKKSNTNAGDFLYDSIACPACNNQCVVTIVPDYDYADGQAYLSDVYAEFLKCYFCDLELSTYEEFNYIDIDKLLAEEGEEKL